MKMCRICVKSMKYNLNKMQAKNMHFISQYSTKSYTIYKLKGAMLFYMH